MRSSSSTRTTYSPGSSVTANANGANRWPSVVLVKPDRTTAPSRSTSHPTVASNTAASPLTSTSRPTVAPCAGASIWTSVCRRR